MHSYIATPPSNNIFLPLPTPQEMKEWDALAISHFGLLPQVLMENASRASLRVLEQQVALTPATKVLILAGNGNNGGDGIALARHLFLLGYQILLCIPASLHNQTSATTEQLHMAQSIGITCLPLASSLANTLPAEWQIPDVIVDSLCGTGLQGEVKPLIQTIIHDVNTRKKHSFIFALDIPTGLCGYTGKPLPVAIEAHATISFEAGKPGLLFPEAKDYVGKLFITPIGIPVSNVQALKPHSWQLIQPQAHSLPRPSAHMHKGSAGKVLIIGGSGSMHGAPVLAALGALRAGAGVVHIACPLGIRSSCQQHYPEIIVHGVGACDEWQSESTYELQSLITSIAPHAIVIGPGMGKNENVKAILEQVLALPNRCPLIIDADALFHFTLPENSHTESKDQLVNLLQQDDILTPHPGEMAQLLPASFFSKILQQYSPHHNTPLSNSQYVQLERVQALEFFTMHSPATLILKGAGTLIGKATFPHTLCSIATPTLAVAGSGDVLTGIIGANLATGCTSHVAASLGVYLHAKAGEYLQTISPRGHLASEIAHAVPLILQQFYAK